MFSNILKGLELLTRFFIILELYKIKNCNLTECKKKCQVLYIYLSVLLLGINSFIFQLNAIVVIAASGVLSECKSQ